MLVFALIVLVSIWFMFVTSKNELAPTEDQSILFFQAVAPQTATVEYNQVYAKQIVDIFETFPEYTRASSWWASAATQHDLRRLQDDLHHRARALPDGDQPGASGQARPGGGLQVAAFPAPACRRRAAACRCSS